MRFATKFDRWLVILLVLVAIVTCIVLPAIGFLAQSSHDEPPWFAHMPMGDLAGRAALYLPPAL